MKRSYTHMAIAIHNGRTDEMDYQVKEDCCKDELKQYDACCLTGKREVAGALSVSLEREVAEVIGSGNAGTHALQDKDNEHPGESTVTTAYRRAEGSRNSGEDAACPATPSATGALSRSKKRTTSSTGERRPRRKPAKHTKASDARTRSRAGDCGCDGAACKGRRA